MFNCVVSSSCFLCSDCFVCYCQYQCKWLTGTTQFRWCGCAHSCTRSLVCLCASKRWQIFVSTTYIQYHIQARAQNSAHLYISGMRRIFVFNSTPIRSGSSKVCYKYKYKIKTYNAPYVTRVIRRRGNNLGLTRYDIEWPNLDWWRNWRALSILTRAFRGRLCAKLSSTSDVKSSCV